MKNLDALPGLVSRLVREARSRFVGYDRQMLAMLSDVVLQTGDLSVRRKAELSSNLGSVADTAMARELQTVSESFDEVIQAAELAESQFLTEQRDSRVAGIVNAWVDQLRRNVRAVHGAYERILLRAQLDPSRPIRDLAIDAWKIERATIRLTYRDTLGRQWLGDGYAALVLKQNMFALLNDVTRYELSVSGATDAYVYAPDHVYNELRFRLGASKESLPSYDDISERVFHPNSEALIVSSLESK